VYGRDRGHLVRGIDHWGLHEVSGEAMGRETVGGVQLRSGALGGDGVAQGRRGVAVLGLCKAGRVGASAGRRSVTGGRGRQGGRRIEGERGFGQGLASGYPLLLDAN
jgi:hypothetical protein